MSRFPSTHNPVPFWTPTRIDQGVDGTLSDLGFRAPFECKVLEAVDYTAGWKGGWVVAEILAGPFSGQGFYVAEGCKLARGLQAGQVVSRGVRLCARQNNGYNDVYGNIECGWVAADGNRPLAQALAGYAGDQSVQAITCGAAFNLFIEQCGGRGGVNESGLSPDWSRLPQSLRKALQV